MTKLEDLFQDYDMNSDNHWNKAEFDDFMQDFGGDTKDYTKDLIFDYMDTSKDGKVSMSEFIKAFK